MATQPKTMQSQWLDSYLTAGSEGYIEDLYEQYLANPNAVTSEWRDYFNQLSSQMKRALPDVAHSEIKEQFLNLAKSSRTQASFESVYDEKQERVLELINAYRRFGHLQAQTDPLGLNKGTYHPSLELAYYGFTDQDLSKTYHVGSFTGLNKASGTLAEIYQALRNIYSATIGFEYMHINRAEEVEWLRDRIEQGFANFKPSDAEKKRILDRLVVADGLEKYLGFKYVGQKRFSLEGGDSLIPMLDVIVNRSAEQGVKETIIGMAHRGRLNVLTNIVGKDPKLIFAAFEGKGVSETHSGDVKYHLGCSSDVVTGFGTTHIALSFNPSHLEIVSPVVQGSVRARQRRRKDQDQTQVMAIQIHGDAAFAGQGCVMETFQMSQTRWFKIGGSLHIVINNQVGFTTSNPADSRSTTYCTDVSKMIEAPVIHVNANHPEAAYFAGILAFEYRSKFKRDVIIDLVCYRRHGHNEADEPVGTQPLMYRVIKAMPVPYVLYAEKLRAEKVISEGDEKKLADDYRAALDAGNRVVKVDTDPKAYEYNVNWDLYKNAAWTDKVNTGVPLKRLNDLGKALQRLPEGFSLQPQVSKMLESQKKMAAGEIPLNWGYAETLAYASLLDEGYAIRLCGQDAGRGTFSHRHAVLHDQNTDAAYLPLSQVSPKQAHINVIDSFLSEEAVLAFEYGYASTEPNNFVIWEAQFGDFANGAQVVIDQFISSGEQKWGRLCGLTMLLPHGYEGQGPEHSSARLERYLQLCAQDNMQVCMPTTPAQIFHLLRRQMLRKYRKPLIIMSPKSVLRHPLATSTLDDLANGEFQTAIPEIDTVDAKKVTRVIFTSGKVYYDLLEQRREKKLSHIAIIRIEQLYPFPEELTRKLLKNYSAAKEVIWCQEEPENQGAWPAVQASLQALLSNGQTLRYAGRPSSASPAVGYHSVHEKQQHELVNQALT